MKPKLFKNKILIYFIFGIALPCLLLGYFAFRGIQNDLALVEKQTWDKQREIAALVVTEFADSISAIEDTYFHSFTKNQNSPNVVEKPAFQTIKKQVPQILELFRLDSSGAIHFVSTKWLMKSEEKVSSIENTSGLNHKPHFQAGQKYEFQVRDLIHAKSEYEKALALAADQRMRGIYLNSIARVQKKMSEWKGAIDSYQRLMVEFSDVKSENNMPWGLVAGVELGSTYLLNHDTLKAVQTQLHVYEKLIQNEWKLEKSQFHFFANLIRTNLQQVFSVELKEPSFRNYENDFKMKIRAEFQLRGFIEYLSLFQQDAPNIFADEEIVNQLAGTGKIRSSVNIHEKEYLVSVFVVHGESQAGEKYGIIWNADSMKSTLVSNFISSRFSGETNTWQLVDRSGRIISESNEGAAHKLMITQSFTDNFPPWFLKLYQKNEFQLEAIFLSRRSIYFYIFILIAGILIFGLALTSISVSRELELARLKSDFVSTISHEFRSPLTSIGQLAEMLQSNRIIDESRRQKYYDVILEQSNRLAMLVNNILDFSKMEEGKKRFDFERVRLDEFIRRFISTIQTRVDHDGFRLDVEMENPLPTLQLDSVAMTRALTNLVDNGIKYSGESRDMRISAAAKNNTVEITVEDFGIGIEREEIEKIFDRFYRGGDVLTRSAIKGSGLGLTLVRQIVEAHKGGITVKSEVGKGSCFTIRLPIDEVKS